MSQNDHTIVKLIHRRNAQPRKPEGLPPATWTESEILGLVTGPPNSCVWSLWIAAFHIAWSPMHMCASPGTAGVNVSHRMCHPLVAGCKLVAWRGVGLGPWLLTQSGLMLWNLPFF